MAEVSRLKYIQWRPIGVCDCGVGKERKAKIFSKSDLSIVLAPGVSRNNWQQKPEVLQLIERYAKDVIELSDLTRQMKNPEIEDIQLVGAVLGHEKTPGLNRESSDGKVQFFQVSFREGKVRSVSKWKKRLKYLLAIIAAIFIAVLLFMLVSRLMNLSVRKKQNVQVECSQSTPQATYSRELQTIQKSLSSELKNLPAWSTFQEARMACLGRSRDIRQQEQQLFQCIFSVRNRIQKIPKAARPDMQRIESCARNICQKNAPYLDQFCKRL